MKKYKVNSWVRYRVEATVVADNEDAAEYLVMDKFRRLGDCIIDYDTNPDPIVTEVNV